jgi:hypothetical protein
MNRNSSSTSSASSKLNFGDIAFILWILLILALVIWTGSLSFKNGLKTEIVKANGLAWIDWLSQASQERFELSYKIPACAGQSTQLAPVKNHPLKKNFNNLIKRTKLLGQSVFKA